MIVCGLGIRVRGLDGDRVWSLEGFRGSTSLGFQDRPCTLEKG